MVEEKSNVTRLCYVKRMECGSMLSIAVLARRFLLISMNSNFCHQFQNIGGSKSQTQAYSEGSSTRKCPCGSAPCVWFRGRILRWRKSYTENHHDVRSAVCTVVTSVFMADDSDN